MSRYTSYVINFSDENHQSEIDLSPFVISDFAEHMMGAIARNHVVNNAPNRRSITRQEPPKSRIPTYKCESDIGECTICQAQMKKGQMICVEGKLSTKKWKAKDGAVRSSTEIIASNLIPLDWKD